MPAATSNKWKFKMDETIREDLAHMTRSPEIGKFQDGLIDLSRIWILSIFMLFQTQFVGFPRLAFLMIMR